MEKQDKYSSSEDGAVNTPTVGSFDPNLPTLEPKDKLDSVELGVAEVGEYEEDSPYPEVRASVPPTDEDVPVNTVRAWTMGIVWTIVVSGANQFFGMHNPPLGLSSYLIILLSLPIGHILARILPTKSWNIFGKSFTLNPGPFNRKEHTLIAIMSVATSSYDSGEVAAWVWTAMVKTFDIPVSAGYRFMFILSSQTLCLGIAYIFEQILVEPSWCVWPSALPTCSLLIGMHDKKFQNQATSGWVMHRMKFFWIVLVGTLLYQFIPGYVFTGLTTFAWITWIAPNNVALNQVFGATSGMDLLPLTLDWNQITSYMGSPLMIPSWAIFNVISGSIFFLWIISPALHWSNVWEGLYFPFSSSSIFDNTGASYNVSRVMTAQYTLNEEAYHAYSPIYMSTTSVLSYGLGLGCVTSIIVHTYLHHGDEVWSGLKKIFSRENVEVEEKDIHKRLMKKYPKVPLWWSAGWFIITIALTILFVEYFNTGLPWWGVFLSVGINIVLIIPIGIMAALCNVAASTNILSALIGGSIWTGKMIPVVIFKIITFNTTGTAMVILRDMKLGHYMKMPPRTVFMAQIIGMVVNCVVQTGVNIWELSHIEGICTGAATGNMLCPISQGYHASITFWGLIGPKKLFSPGAMYNSMLYFFLIGAILPIILYFVARRFPTNKFIKQIHVPLIMSSTAAIPPATAGNFMPWAVVGIYFNYYLRKYYLAWWSKYNYLLSAALDAGLAVATFLIFFCLYYTNTNFSWWGNNIASMTADGLGTPLRTVAEGQHFGPDTWK